MAYLLRGSLEVWQIITIIDQLKDFSSVQKTASKCIVPSTYGVSLAWVPLGFVLIWLITTVLVYNVTLTSVCIDGM